MALKCPSCNSLSTQILVDKYQCNDCAALATFDGKVAEAGPDATTRALYESRLAPRQTNIVGNFADLQRMGGSLSSGDEVTTTSSAKADAKVTAKASK